MFTVTVVGPSDIAACADIIGVDESIIGDIAIETGAMLAEQQKSLITVPYKGIGYYSAKGYIDAGGESLIGVLPKGVISRITTKEIIEVDNWVRQPEALASRAKLMIVIGMSAGTLIEICLTKRFKSYPVLAYKDLLTNIPKEVERELNIQYISHRKELESAVNGLTSGYGYNCRAKST